MPLARMQTTFLDLRVFPPPPASSNILAGRYGARARRTANARVALVMQRIIGNAELFKISPYVRQAPVQQWAEFLKTVDSVKFRLSQILSCRRLITTQAGDPCVLSAQSAFQRLHLANMTAALA